MKTYKSTERLKLLSCKANACRPTDRLQRRNPQRSGALDGRRERVNVGVDFLVTTQFRDNLGFFTEAIVIHTCIVSRVVSDYRNVSNGISRNLG